jgi:replicative DNA helicase
MEAHPGKAKDHGGQRTLEPRGSSQLLGWPEFGLGLREDVDDPEMVDVIHWRGDRIGGRGWPTKMHYGSPWPWVDATPGRNGEGNG